MAYSPVVKTMLCGKEILIEKKDLSFLTGRAWQLLKPKNPEANNYYFIRTKWNSKEKKYKSILLHREIMGRIKKGMVVDHVNGNTLHLYRNNLRICTQGQNKCNSSKHSNNKNKYKGVSFQHGKFTSHICFNKKQIHLGRFVKEENAAKAYDKKARELFGEYAKLNFPNWDDNFRRRKSSIYIGVSMSKFFKNCKKPFHAQIRNNKGEVVNLGGYKTQNDAAIAYNKAALLIHGDSAILNELIDLPETTKQNPNWLKTKRGRYWKERSKKEIIEEIIKNTNSFNKEDNGIIISFLRGDNECMGKLMEKYNEYLTKDLEWWHRHKSRNLSRKYKIELEYTCSDMVQEGFMIAMRDIKRGRYWGHTFKNWVRIIIRNKWASFINKKFNFPPISYKERKKRLGISS